MVILKLYVMTFDAVDVFGLDFYTFYLNPTQHTLTLISDKETDGAKFIVDKKSEKKIVNGIFYLQDLPTALKVAKDGDKIILQPGKYVLNKNTETLTKSIQIHGQGHDKTKISVLGLYFILIHKVEIRHIFFSKVK